jgi:TfoX/Sxy family transcriptional regulator of competence genes
VASSSGSDPELEGVTRSCRECNDDSGRNGRSWLRAWARTITDHGVRRELAERIRQTVAGEPGVTEKKMFGGLAFLVGGNMAVAASGQGGLMVRVDPGESDALVSSSPARVVEMRGRQMPGWLRVDSEDVKTDEELSAWVERGVSFARALPPK